MCTYVFFNVWHFSIPFTSIHSYAGEVTKGEVISNWLQRQWHAIHRMTSIVLLNIFISPTRFCTAVYTAWLKFQRVFCSMPLIRARRSMHCWRRTSFLFLMVLKLCGCEECEYSVYIWTHLCSKPLCFIVWLWGQTRKDKRGKRVSWLTGESFLWCERSINRRRDYAVNDTLMRQIKDLWCMSW